MKTKDWFAFLALSLSWGSSFLWIKIALEEMTPLTLVAIRIGIGLLALVVVVMIKRPEWPIGRRIWGVLAIMGLTNIALPYALITWGEIYIDSAVASILNSTVPLFTAVLAHFFIAEERLSWKRAGGLLLGFAGVLILLLRDFSGDVKLNLLGQGAVLLAAISYAGSTIFGRLNTRGGSPIVQSLIQVLFANGFMWGSVFAFEDAIKLPELPITWVAVIWLGVIGTCIAYLLYFYLLHSIGPTRTIMVTYLFPVIGVLLGWLFLNEALSWHLWAGGVLVIGSVIIMNQKSKVTN